MTDQTTTDEPTVLDVRRSLVEAADSCHEHAKTYRDARKDDGAPFYAWIGYMTAANFANIAAAILGQVAMDHGEEYASRLAQIAADAEDDGEGAYFANDDVRGLEMLGEDAADLALVQARAATDNGNRTPLADVLAEFDMTENDMETEGR